MAVCTRPASQLFVLKLTEVVLGDSEGKEKDFLFVNEDGVKSQYCISENVYQKPIWNGINLGLNTSKDQIEFDSFTEIYENRVETILNHPFTQFKLGKDGNGIGIADIRDLRNGSKINLRFDLFQIDLAISIIRHIDRSTLILSWNKSDYSPF